jgi:hypothetical protein
MGESYASWPGHLASAVVAVVLSEAEGRRTDSRAAPFSRTAGFQPAFFSSL